MPPRPLVPTRLVLLAVPILAGFPAPAGEVAPAPRRGVVPASAAAAVDKKVLAEVKDRAEVMANLQYLSDVIGPRLTGSAGLARANRWAADKMRGYGLEDVRLEPWEIPVGWERGPISVRLADPDNPRPLLAAARGWTPGTAGKVVAEVVVFRGRTKADLAAYKGKLKNALVLQGPPADVAPVADRSYGPAKKDGPPADGKKPGKDGPPADSPGGGPKRPSFEEMVAFRREVADFLKAEGAAAVASDAGKPHGLLVTTGSWRQGDRGTPQDPVPGLFLAHEHYALLHRLATAKDANPVRVELDVANTFVPGPVTVYNTVGEVRGADKPDEYVVVGAHLDSWDLATGTTDNGTGSCVVLEAARAVAALARQGHRPRRTVRFVLFSGEEQGLYGSKEYVRRHKDELPRTSAALVHDTGTGAVTGFGLLGREAVKKVLEPELAALKDLPGWTGLTLGGIRGGTDHWSFDQVGVPGFACSQDIDEYRFTHHTQSDTFDKAKEPNLVQGAQVMAATALRVANLPGLLPRDKPPEKADGPRRGGRKAGDKDKDGDKKDD